LLPLETGLLEDFANTSRIALLVNSSPGLNHLPAPPDPT
jgi:hypothetical protein